MKKEIKKDEKRYKKKKRNKKNPTRDVLFEKTITTRWRVAKL